MPVRKLTLQEWFLAHQLRKLWREHFYIPMDLDVDISRIEAVYQLRGKPTPYTAILAKALALAAAKRPAMNRMYLRTFYGPRIVDFDHISVNLPVVLNRNGQRHMSAVVIRNAARLTIHEIRAVIREGRRKLPGETPVGRFVHGRPNNLWNRLRLRAIHFAVYNFPGMFLAKLAGGLSVSSLISELGEDFPGRAMAFGPTAFTVALCSVDRSVPGKTILRLGLGIDHCACRGDEGAAGVQALHDALCARDERDLEALTH